MVRENDLRPKPGDADPAENVDASDFFAFTLTIFFVLRSKKVGLKTSAIWRTIAEDATRYFLFIFTSHFVLEAALSFGSVSTTAHLLDYSECHPIRASLGIGAIGFIFCFVSHSRSVFNAGFLNVLFATTISGNVV